MTNYDKMYGLLIDNGMQPKVAKLFIKKFRIEEENYSCSEEAKKWAMTKGFFPSQIELFGLNNDNYQYYLPEYVDYMLHPYNNHFAIWINDKLTLKYTLGSDFSDIMPKYYLYIENNGEYTYLWDAPNNIAKDEFFILNLLKNKKCLIIKPNSSTSGGDGVMKVEWIDNQIRINNRELLSKDNFMLRIKSLGNNIVTEYAFQHHFLRKIWPDSECTLRIVMNKLSSEDLYSEKHWKCVSSFARFGTSESGGTSNLSAGGIGVGFNFETGKLNSSGSRYLQFSQGVNYEHPDTHVVWDSIILPNWDYVKNNLLAVCKHYGSLSHLGFDVIITENGFVLCEINSKPETVVSQMECCPLLLQKDNRQYYIDKGLDKIDSSVFYSIYKNSQE